MPRNYKRVEREHKTHTRVNEDDRARALALIDAGFNTSQIEDQTGVSRSQIRRYKRNLRMWNSPSAPRLKAAARPSRPRPSESTAVAPEPSPNFADDDHDSLLDVARGLRPRDRNAMQPSRMLELSALVSSTAASIDHYLRVRGLPLPSFDEHAPVDPVPVDVPEMQQARAALLDAAAELQDLLSGPAQLCRPTWTGTSIHAIQRFRIAQHVPMDGSISFLHLAQACNVSEPLLRRILRHAMVHHRIFAEPAVGFVAHTAASRLLAVDEALQDEVAATCDELQPSFAHTVDAVRTYMDDEPQHSGFALANRGDVDPQTLEHRDSMRAQAVSTVLAPLREGVPFAIEPMRGTNGPNAMLLGAFPWAMLQRGATVVDMGTAPDSAALCIPEVFPHIDLVVQGAAQATEIPEHLLDRVSVQTHDVFEDEQHIVGADVYLIRGLFREWPDKYCVRILQKLVPALKVGARVIVSDVVMPDAKTMPLHLERRARQSDLTMMALRNSREREADDWTRLFYRADRRFRVATVQPPAPGYGTSTVEVIWSRC